MSKLLTVSYWLLASIRPDEEELRANKQKLAHHLSFINNDY
jgi:hypothetical protein